MKDILLNEFVFYQDEDSMYHCRKCNNKKSKKITCTVWVEHIVIHCCGIYGVNDKNELINRSKSAKVIEWLKDPKNAPSSKMNDICDTSNDSDEDPDMSM